MSNNFSIYTKEKEYKIYCGKKLKEYHRKLSWIARKFDIPRGATNYSGAAKEAIQQILNAYNPLFYNHYKGNLEKIFSLLAGKTLDIMKNDQKKETITFPETNNGITLLCINLCCSYSGYTVSDAEKNELQVQELRKLFDELGIIPTMERVNMVKDWIREHKILFRKYIEEHTDFDILSILFIYLKNKKR